jgi:predicted ATPase
MAPVWPTWSHRRSASVNQAGRSVMETLIDVLRPRRCLLVLDSCEHVINACTEVAERLLRACPSLNLLATSREPLGCPGETVWRVPPLAFPDTSDEQTSRSVLVDAYLNSQFEAVRLFVERGQSALPGFALTQHNVSAVIQICRQLDGIPLAIELAATLVRALSPMQITARLDDHFRILTGGSRTSLPRNQTLRGAIDWSYDLLTAEERALFRRLSVFAGGFSLGAAEIVCSGNGIEAQAVLNLMVRLVDKSLVVADDRDLQLRGESEVRYRLLESLR